MSSFLKSSKSISARLASMVIGSWEVNQLYSMLPLQSSSPEQYEDQRRLVTVKSMKMAMILMMMDVMITMMFTKGRVSEACCGR